MAKKTYKPEEIVSKLRQVDVLRSQGMTIAKLDQQGLELNSPSVNIAHQIVHVSVSCRLATRQHTRRFTPISSTYTGVRSQL